MVLPSSTVTPVAGALTRRAAVAALFERGLIMQKNQMYGHEQFVCVWNVATDKFVTEIHGADFFSHDNGYSDDDIEYVTDLLIGESTDISGPTQAHYVLRVA